MPTLDVPFAVVFGKYGKAGRMSEPNIVDPHIFAHQPQGDRFRRDFCDRRTLEQRRNAPIKLPTFPTTGAANPLQLLNDIGRDDRRDADPSVLPERFQIF